MLRILYVTNVSKEYGGKFNGGIATHSSQLIKKAAEKYIVALYSSILKLNMIQNVRLYSCSEFKITKLLKALSVVPFINRERIKRLCFLSVKDKILVLYHYNKFRKIINDYDVIHVHSLFRRETIALSLFEKRPKIIVTDHGFWQGDINTELKIVQYNSYNADNVIYISEFAKSMHRKYDLNLNNLVKIENPFMYKSLNSEYIELIKKNFNIERDKKVLFFSGVSEPLKRKGLDVFLHSIKQNEFLRKNTVSIIVTNKEGILYSQKYDKDCSLILIKPIPYEDVIDIYGIADIFVLPSRSESFGLVYIEALSFGVPVIGFDKVIREFKSNYDSCYIGECFDPINENIESLSYKIEKVLRKEVDKKKLIEKTRELYSWDNNFIKFEEIYKS